MADPPTFTLTVVTSADGFIARAPDDAPQNWASSEEQALFFRDVEAADWAVMGRHTHEAADKPDRRRIIFSTKKSGWRRETQLWTDPTGLSPNDFPSLVEGRYPLQNALILGGTRVHDWFLRRGAIHRIHLTIEPVLFGKGLPVFSDQLQHNPVTVFASRGFAVERREVLNAGGTEYLEFRAK